MSQSSCSPNAAAAYHFFLRKGLKDFQAAAIVGNLQVESGINPQENTGDGGSARGIAQWHRPRWDQLLRYAAAIGQTEWSLDTQLNFVWYELEHVRATGLVELVASTSLERAVVVFQDNFERCGICNTPARVRAAQRALSECPAVVPPRKNASGLWLPVLGAVALAGALGIAAKRGRNPR